MEIYAPVIITECTQASKDNICYRSGRQTNVFVCCLQWLIININFSNILDYIDLKVPVLQIIAWKLGFRPNFQQTAVTVTSYFLLLLLPMNPLSFIVVTKKIVNEKIVNYELNSSGENTHSPTIFLMTSGQTDA